MGQDLVDINKKTEAQLREERERWASREATILVLSVYEQLVTTEQVAVYPEYRELFRAIAYKALLKGYQYGYDHGYTVQRVIESTPHAISEQATAENVEATVFGWLVNNPSTKVLTICRRLTAEGYPLPTHLAWAARLRDYAEEMQDEEPWLVWRDAVEGKQLRAGLDSWVSEMRRKVKMLSGARKLTRASRDCVMPTTPIWGQTEEV